ncbi:MAG: HD-GYP domain-containing protein [Thermodesulfobacteriota bacterium]
MIYGKGVLEIIPGLKIVPGPESVYLPLPRNGSRVLREKGTPVFLQETVNALLRTLAARDPYTGHHSTRVTEVSLAFARFLGLPADDLEALGHATYLHDIGKIGISDTILLKPGRLTPEEREIIETHPLIGEKIVEPLGLRTQEKDIILLHHERWDGGGYPNGLAQEKIPFLCRLVALVDCFDALTSDRPYRRRFAFPDALAEIESQAGKQFDPDLAQKFLELMTSPISKVVEQYRFPTSAIGR